MRAAGRIVRRGFLTGIGAGISVAVVSGKAKAAQFEYKFAHNQSVESPIYVRTTQMWRAVEKESGGRLRVQVFPNSILGGESQMLSQLRLGAIEFFALSGTSLSSVVPAAGLEAVPFAFRGYRDVYAPFDGALGDYIRSEIASKGIHPFGKVMGYGFYQLTNSVRPIRTVEDIVGLKFRTAVSRITVDTFKTLGASATPMNFVESYTALQTHVVDGQINPYPIIENGKLYEVQKYLSEVNMLFAFPWMMANPQAWNALPSEVQAVVERNAVKYALLQRKDTVLYAAASADKLVRQGMIRNQADQRSFKQKLSATGFYARWRDEFGSKAWSLLEESVGKLGS